jgi:beta-lactamase superfamily II metal-dependent hydrolase
VKKRIQLCLAKQEVSELKYIIGTHPDAEHVSGSDVIITTHKI